MHFVFGISNTYTHVVLHGVFDGVQKSETNFLAGKFKQKSLLVKPDL